MRKEPIIAIILGSVVGLTFAFGVWKFTQSAEKSHISQTQKAQERKQQQEQISSGLSVLEPTDQQVYSQPIISVSGLSTPGTLVAVATSDSYLITQVRDDGTFQTEVPLSGGPEVVYIWSFDSAMQSIKVPVIYSSQIDTGDTSLTALSGTITDISEQTIQIKTPEDQIEQVSVNDDTTYANILSDTNEIEFSELAIGDYVAAIGKQNNSSVLEASRIMVTSTTDMNEAIAIKGTVKALTNSDFLVDVDGKEYSIDATGGVDVTTLENNTLVETKLSNANEGEDIIIIGYLDDDEVQAEAIQIFSQAPEEK